MLGKVGMPELLIILGIIVLIFGPSRLPQFGKAIGQTIREFRGIRKTLDETADEAREIGDKVKQAVNR